MLYPSALRPSSWPLMIIVSAIVLTHVDAQPATSLSSEVPAATPTPTPGSVYRQTNLTSDWPGLAPIQDQLLVNPWGIAMTSSSPFWLANNGTSTSSLYRGDVGSTIFAKQPGMSFITIPQALPTGAVANAGGTT